MKKYRLILLLMIFVFCFCACSNTNEKKPPLAEWRYCGEIDLIGDNLNVCYDTKTKVMYAYRGYALTVLLNADGTPMLYEDKE